MAILNFTLGPESLGKLHDALVCLGKFSESVAIEAAHDKLMFTALNSSKSAYASFTFVGNKFFTKYQYRPPRSGNQAKDKITWKIYNRALLSVFKGRVQDPTREKDTGVERCDVTIEDGDVSTKSRFIVKIVCRHGVLKTYRLTFEETPPMHAMFVKASANNCWAISSKALREFIEHFGPGTEQLDIYSDDGRVSLTSFTEKIVSGTEILKQPLHTTIAIDTLEFGEFSVEEKLHIVISVKDFKSIIAHAGISNTMIKALYSRPSSPMQLTYGEEGITVEFILMTIGDVRGASATPAPGASRASSKRPASRQPLDATSSSKRPNVSGMPPPPASAAPSLNRQALSRKDSRPSPPPPQPSIQNDALFIPAQNEDDKWNPHDFDDESDEMLLWDHEREGRPEPVTVNSGRPQVAVIHEQPRISTGRGDGFDNANGHTVPTQRIAPTQRVSEVKGIFD